MSTDGADFAAIGARIEELVAHPPTEEAADALCRILANLAYLRNYIAGNRRYLRDEPSGAQAAAILDDVALARRTARLLEGVGDGRNIGVGTRGAWHKWCVEAETRIGWEREDRAFGDAIAALRARLQDDRAALLKRLGASDATPPEQAFSRLAGRIESAELRTKLAALWEETGRHRVDALSGRIDALAAARHARTAAAGFASPWAHSFGDSPIDAGEAGAFIARFVQRVRSGSDRLAAQIASTTGSGTARAFDHFDFFLRKIAGACTPQLLSVEPCLAVLVGLARDVFGVRLTEDGRFDHFIRYRASAGQADRGMIVVDLLQPGGTRLANGPAMPLSGLSVGRILCRLRCLEGRTGLSFDALHALFHEFGHALDHVLSDAIRPSRSGLDQMSLESSETLSGWFEKWVFHDGLAGALCLDDADRERLCVAQRIKRFESLRSLHALAALSLIDFEVHSERKVATASALKQVRTALGKEVGFDAAQCLGEFAHPMLRFFPGAAFTFPWGSCAGAEAFAPFRSVAIAHAGRVVRPAWVGPGAAYGRVPSPEPLFALYEEALQERGSA